MLSSIPRWLQGMMSNAGHRDNARISKVHTSNVYGCEEGDCKYNGEEDENNCNDRFGNICYLESSQAHKIFADPSILRERGINVISRKSINKERDITSMIVKNALRITPAMKTARNDP